MVRYDYIYHKVLMLYDQMPFIRFPIEPCDMIAALANCKQLTYQKFAEINGCTIQDVIALCQSKSGCTHYDVAEDRYLILWNADGAENNVEGRRRWTKAHELGHVVLEHLPPLAVPKLAENSFQRLTAPELEFEADRFAATLLAPAPLYADLHILCLPRRQATVGQTISAGYIAIGKPPGKMISDRFTSGKKVESCPLFMAFRCTFCFVRCFSKRT